LYQYLFSSSTPQVFPLISKIQDSNTFGTSIQPIPASALPLLYEGGEFTVSAWIYIAKWSPPTIFTQNHLIMAITDPTSNSDVNPFSISLGPQKPKIYVKVNGKNDLYAGGPMMDGDLIVDSKTTCELPEIDLQKWVNVTVAVNGKTVDSYLDGKLMRSCVLDKSLRVGKSYQATLLTNGGFPGKISNTNMYDIALNPEQVYRIYMNGPDGSTDIISWLKNSFVSLF